ncbi:RNA-directed DNA polymerase, eukaryota [Tanacetum coccineum]
MVVGSFLNYNLFGPMLFEPFMDLGWSFIRILLNLFGASSCVKSNSLLRKASIFFLGARFVLGIGSISMILGSVSLSLLQNRGICDCNGEGVFHVKDIRSALDDHFLPSADVVTRLVKSVPIKVNIFAWRARLNRLPTRGNLLARGVSLDSSLCPIVKVAKKTPIIFFSCNLGQMQPLSKYLPMAESPMEDVSSFCSWYSWFSSINLSDKRKNHSEGVFYTSSCGILVDSATY